MTPRPHWSERWIGRDWVAGAYECSDFVAEVLAAEFGVAVRLPRAGPHIRERDRLVEITSPGLARRRRPGERALEGDGVLMRARGRRNAIGHHIGLWCLPGGEPSALHCAAGLGSCVHPLAGLPARGLELAGVYAWLAEPDPALALAHRR